MLKKNFLFKKIKIWIVLLVRQELVGTIKFGKVSKLALFIAEVPRNMKIIYQYLKDKTMIFQQTNTRIKLLLIKKE